MTFVVLIRLEQYIPSMQVLWGGVRPSPNILILSEYVIHLLLSCPVIDLLLSCPHLPYNMVGCDGYVGQTTLIATTPLVFYWATLSSVMG